MGKSCENELRKKYRSIRTFATLPYYSSGRLYLSPPKAVREAVESISDSFMSNHTLANKHLPWVVRGCRDDDSQIPARFRTRGYGTARFPFPLPS